MSNEQPHIYFISPFSIQKKYGSELNHCIEMLPENSWVAVMDLDAMFLNPSKQIPIMYEYISRHSNTGLFLATSNRSGTPNKQRYNGVISSNDSMAYWLQEAENIVPTYSVSKPVKNFISGHLMLFSKKTWQQIKFSETLSILDVDRTFAQDVLDLGKEIHIMNDILIWHTYRLLTGTREKSHLF